MKWRFREVCFLDLGSCYLSALDSDAQYSRSDPNDLDMVKIEAKLPLYMTTTAVQIHPAAKKMTWKL